MTQQFSGLLPEEPIPFDRACDALPVFFPGKGARQWALHMHRARLVDAGALLMIRGAWYALPSKLATEMMAIAQEAAREWVERKPALARAAA